MNSKYPDSSLPQNNRERLLRISIGIVYLWFGSLKFFAGVSPAETLATETIALLCQGLIPAKLGYTILALVETLIGLMLIGGWRIRTTVIVALAHMVGTFMPLLLMPEVSYNGFPYYMTMEGQYILKNLIIVCALVSLYPLKKIQINPVKNHR